jgi:hypothetical protein
MGDEGPREGAPVQRLEHRRLDLDEALGVQVAAHRGDDLGPRDEDLASVVVGDEVELAMAVARLDVVQAVELVGWWAQALGQQREVLDAQRQLAALGAEREPVDADDVAEIEVEQARHRLLAEHVDLGLQLDAPRAIVEIQEGHATLAAARVQAPGDAVARVGVLPRRQVGVRGVDRAHRLDAGVGVREGLDAVVAKALQLGAPRREELGAVLRAHGATRRRRSW